ELNPDAQDDLTLRAAPLESMTSVFDVDYDESKDSNCSEFRFFEDGRQRTIQIGYIHATYPDNLVLIPIHFFVVGAVVLEREDRKLKLWKGPLIQQGIFVPRSLVPNQSLLEEFERSGLTVVDTESSDTGAPADYYDMRRRALRRAKELRLNVEQKLIAEWRAD